LRFIHLKRHPVTPPLLTPEPIARCTDARGCGAPGPCARVPDRRDPAMWKTRNGCA
jgi:hypothetical protein